jgi:hypothetical protein
LFPILRRALFIKLQALIIALIAPSFGLSAAGALNSGMTELHHDRYANLLNLEN